MRVVLDTSVLVAAARSRRGASSALLLRLLDRTFVPAISVPLFVEYEATLLRSENLLDRDAATVESFRLSALRFPIQMMTLFLSWRLPADCRYLVTTMSGIFADQRNGELWLSLRLTSSNLLRHKHEHRDHPNA
jgi:predicted nucleic acid-binding protein